MLVFKRIRRTCLKIIMISIIAFIVLCAGSSLWFPTHTYSFDSICDERLRHIYKAMELFPNKSRNITESFEMYRQQVMTDEERKAFPLNLSSQHPCFHNKQNIDISAQGCCSYHGGITVCDPRQYECDSRGFYSCSAGKYLCKDGRLSPTCYCK